MKIIKRGLINYMNKLIKETVSEILNVETKDVKIIKQLLGGMSHHTYKVEVNNQYYVIRLIGDDGNLFVDRKEENENIKRIANLGLNNETVYFDTKSGTKLAKYVEGKVLTEVRAEDHLKAVAAAFKTLHNSGINAFKPYGLITRLTKYESFNDKQTDQYLELKTLWLELYYKYYANRKLVFCHNDAQLSNLVINNNKVYMLDWEYAGDNDPFYDIASFGDLALELLDAYLERPATAIEIRDVKFYAMFQWLQWYQVAIYKDKINLSATIDFDFSELARLYMSRVIKMYDEIKDEYIEIK